MIINQSLIAKNDVIVVAVSGGIDSMVLLDQLNRLKKRMNLTLIVAHVNHSVRLVSDEEYEFVQTTAIRYGNHFEGIVFPKLPHARFHEEARHRRYEFFYDVAKKYQANKIALAHHADDQAETILMRLVRGTSFKGYGGMLPETQLSDIVLIRPLLNITRKTIEIEMKKTSLDYRHDASNDEDDYTRNRFRHHILPTLEKENPLYRQKIIQFATYLQEANALVERQANDFIAHYLLIESDCMHFSLSKFNQLDKIIRRDVLKRTFDSFTNNQLELSFKQMEQIFEIIDSDKPHATVSLSKGVEVSKSYDILSFHIETKITNDLPILEITGEGDWQFNRDTFTVTTQKPNINHGISLELWYNNLDLIFPLFVRTRIEGDRIKLGAGTRKIKDLFIDLKLPMTLRDTIPILFNSNNEVLWIPGIRTADFINAGEKVIYVVYKRGSSC
jgi:tRNA(Ile)-lysidine synthase/bifunctional protein TilS/HprT